MDTLNKGKIRIRTEKAEDIEAITRITKAAFKHHPYSHQTEHLIVKELRNSGDLVFIAGG